MNERGTNPVMSKLKRGLVKRMPENTWARVGGKLKTVGPVWKGKLISPEVYEKVSEAIKAGVITQQTVNLPGPGVPGIR
jgi:tRNA G26 N,N-dimethylase Trm1